MKLKEIISVCGGTLYGNPDYEIKSIAKVNNAESDSISFYTGDDQSFIKKTKAGCIIVKFRIKNKNTIVVENPEDY